MRVDPGCLREETMLLIRIGGEQTAHVVL